MRLEVRLFAEDKGIDGKKDDAHHDGKHANDKREQEAAQQLKDAKKDGAK